MKASSILYPLMFIVVIYFIYSNIRDNINYKKENIKILLYLNNDDKLVHLTSSLVMVFMIVATGALVLGMIRTGIFTFENVAVMGVLPVLMIILYIPLSKKTRVSTLGIHKRSYLIRWENIKSVNYLKPDNKNRIKAKIVHLSYSRDTTTTVTFLKDDPQLEEFKEIVKTYKINKKKGKKSGK
ncbi:MAG TPA: hypothetical protein GX396_01485 [Tissierellia bacterium]|jgi:hypothetical protein|nr:hypothetical protein [Tissierellia bacterium]